jgi:hypothetical protein
VASAAAAHDGTGRRWLQTLVRHAGTRVPVKNLVDYLGAGDSLERFLDHFPSVTGRVWAMSRQAADRFDALLTADQNIEFQQNLRDLADCRYCPDRSIESAESLAALVPQLLEILQTLQPKKLRVGA